MSKSKEVFEFAGGLIVVTTAVLFCILIVKMSMGLYHGIVKGWQSAQSHSSAAQQKAKDEAWAKDPTNPKVVAQKCLDAGGYPKVSSWDGSVTCNAKGGSNKNVNIKVNQ